MPVYHAASARERPSPDMTRGLSSDRITDLYVSDPPVAEAWVGTDAGLALFVAEPPP